MPDGVVAAVVQHKKSRIAMKDHDHLALGLPLPQIIRKQMDVTKSEGHVAIHYQVTVINDNIGAFELGWNVDVE
jgi:hypothetical protein